MNKHRRTTPGKRARKRLKAEVKRLKEKVDALESAIIRIRGNNVRTGEVATPSAAMLYESELNAIQRHVLCYPNLETGGSLYGWYSETGLPVIAIATGPGQNARHDSTRFHADEAYSMAVGNQMAAHGLQHLGEWHSHHKISLSQPSAIDCRAMAESLGVHGSPFLRFLCGIANIVGDKVTFGLFYFSTKTGLAYSHTPIVVKNGCSPMRTGIVGTIENINQKGVIL